MWASNTPAGSYQDAYQPAHLPPPSFSGSSASSSHFQHIPGPAVPSLALPPLALQPGPFGHHSQSQHQSHGHGQHHPAAYSSFSNAPHVPPIVTSTAGPAADSPSSTATSSATSNILSSIPRVPEAKNTLVSTKKRRRTGDGAAPDPADQAAAMFHTPVDTFVRLLQFSDPEADKDEPDAQPEPPAQQQQQPDQPDTDSKPRKSKSSPKTATEDKKPHPCARCDKSFAQKAQLNTHMRAHTDEKPFVCPVAHCGQRFSQQGNMRTHLRRHTGERPYVCAECGKSFPQSGNLRAHENTHNRKEYFVCMFDNCGKRLTQLGNLKSHHNRFHSDELARIMNLFKTTKNLAELPPYERDLCKYIANLYKNSNRGIKGRGKNRRISDFSMRGKNAAGPPPTVGQVLHMSAHADSHGLSISLPPSLSIPSASGPLLSPAISQTSGNLTPTTATTSAGSASSMVHHYVSSISPNSAAGSLQHGHHHGQPQSQHSSSHLSIPQPLDCPVPPQQQQHQQQTHHQQQHHHSHPHPHPHPHAQMYHDAQSPIGDVLTPPPDQPGGSSAWMMRPDGTTTRAIQNQPGPPPQANSGLGLGPAHDYYHSSAQSQQQQQQQQQQVNAAAAAAAGHGQQYPHFIPQSPGMSVGDATNSSQQQHSVSVNTDSASNMFASSNAYAGRHSHSTVQQPHHPHYPVHSHHGHHYQAPAPQYQQQASGMF